MTIDCISQGFGLVTFSLGKSIIRIPLKIWSNLEWQSEKFTFNALDNKDFGIVETYCQNLFFYLLKRIPDIFHNFEIYSKYCLRLPLPFKCALKELFIISITKLFLLISYLNCEGNQFVILLFVMIEWFCILKKNQL